VLKYPAPGIKPTYQQEKFATYRFVKETASLFELCPQPKKCQIL